MNTRKITKVELTPDHHVNIKWLEFPPASEEGIDPDKCSREGEHEAHSDLVEQFQALRKHHATICEQGDMTEFEDDANSLDIYRVTAIAITGKDEHEGITVSGTRLLKGNKQLELDTPFVKLNPDHSEYAYIDSMNVVVDQILQEADQYLNGKYAPTRQLSIFPEKKKRGRPRKSEAEEESESEAEVDMMAVSG